MADYPPRTVALVGIDGSGKTTQARLLAAALAEAGWPASYRRNAGGRHWFGRVATAEDLGSTNGTLVNGRRISRQPLSDGDVIRIGHSVLVYRQDGA